MKLLGSAEIGEFYNPLKAIFSVNTTDSQDWKEPLKSVYCGADLGEENSNDAEVARNSI